MSRIIPRFLYHLTNRANYESIMSSGVLRTSSDKFFGEGIFTAELTNLFKRWRRSSDWGAANLQNDLLEQAAKDSSELVILKIPTEGLNVDNIRIRSQNRLFGGVDKYWKLKRQKIHENELLKAEYIDTEMRKLDRSILSEKGIQLMETKIRLRADAMFMEPSSGELLSQIPEKQHMKVGSSIRERKLFQQRKEAIEYIYTEEIPTSQIEKIGEVNVDELRKTTEYDPLKPMRSIFSALLRGTPQEKGALLLNC